MPLLGATFTVSIDASSPELYEPILSALAGPDGAMPPPTLQDKLMESQKAAIAQHVRVFDVSHDGYSVGWEGLGFDVNGPTESIILSIGINIICKDEDFGAFQELLQDEGYEAAATGEVCSVLIQFLTAAKVDAGAYTLAIEANGFGYG